MRSLAALAASARQVPCDLCGDVRFESLAQSDRRGGPLATVICRRCGLVSHESIPSDEELAAYYGTRYRQDYHGESVPAPHRVLRAWEGGQWLLRLLQPYLSPGDRMFEVGAGIGCTVKAFAQAGYQARGIEPGHGFHRYAREALGVELARQSLLDVAPEAAYDLVMLVHVIEHFNWPSRALRHIHRLLRPGGLLYVECPNLAAPHAAPGKWFHYAHIYNFTDDTLRLLAESCGFSVKARLSEPTSRSVRVLLERQPAGEPPAIGPDSYHRCRARLARYTGWSYHVRWGYLAERIARDARFLSHHIFPRMRLRRWVRRGQPSADSTRWETRPNDLRPSRSWCHDL